MHLTLQTGMLGNRMRPFVRAGLFEDVSDIWVDSGWQDGEINNSMAHAKKSMTIAGRQWGVPYTYYQWVYITAKISLKRWALLYQRHLTSLLQLVQS